MTHTHDDQSAQHTRGGTASRAAAVLVTGASRGIGRGIAVALAGRGYSVAINYRSNATAAEDTAGLCRVAYARKAPSEGGPPPRFVPLQGDIASAEDRARLVAESVDAFGGLDGLVNNAGVAPAARADIVEATEESFSDLLRTNLQGPYFMTQEVVRYWLGARPREAAAEETSLAGGLPPASPSVLTRRAVVFVTSVSSETASVARGEYCVSKAGLSMAVHLWAVRLANEGIDVFEVRPGIIETDMTSVVKEKYDVLIADGLVPQRRWGTAEDIGRIVRSLVAGEFGFSTGSVIHSDGGLHLSIL